jgi:hypothetical protein
MTSYQAIIPIISGWNQIIFDDGLIPSDRMLAQLLRPNIDLNSAALHWHEMSEANNIPDLDSQVILQDWSNYVILQMCVTSDNPVKQENAEVISHFISNLSEANNINRAEPLYHHNVSRYLHNLIFLENLIRLSQHYGDNVELSFVKPSPSKGFTLRITMKRS